jgi:3-oxoacyl-[acyl-carrier protein] reductase
MKLEGKVAVVTGASRGIGKAIALKLASEGANVAINYTRSDELAIAVRDEIIEMGQDAMVFNADVSSEADVKAFAGAVKEKFGKIDILINNAGITKDGLILRMKEDDFSRVIDINLKGTFLCSKHFGKLMIKAKSGAIVNIASVVGITGNAGQANYVASKAGVIGLTKTLAKEFGSRGLTVNAVAPGFIETEMTDILSEELKLEYSKGIPLGAFGKSEDVANCVVFLSSSDSHYITGQVINVDGGMVM